VANKRFKELLNLSQDELAVRLRETEQKLFEGRMKKFRNDLKDTAMIWRLRKDFARMKTLLSRKGGEEKKHGHE